MPEICRFFGIIIRMFYEDHLPPHFHAEYGDHEAIIHIYTLGIIAGSLPHRALGLVMEWASLHSEELIDCWNKAKNLEPLGHIQPLD